MSDEELAYVSVKGMLYQIILCQLVLGHIDQLLLVKFIILKLGQIKNECCYVGLVCLSEELAYAVSGPQGHTSAVRFSLCAIRC